MTALLLANGLPRRRLSIPPSRGCAEKLRLIPSMKLTKASESCWVVTSVEGTHDTWRWPGSLITQEVRLKGLSESSVGSRSTNTGEKGTRKRNAKIGICYLNSPTSDFTPRRICFECRVGALQPADFRRCIPRSCRTPSFAETTEGDLTIPKGSGRDRLGLLPVVPLSAWPRPLAPFETGQFLSTVRQVRNRR